MRQPGSVPRDAVDEIEISSPCTVSWDEMRQTPGDERVRFCGHCRQNVYSVETMSRSEARQLIGAREGRVCVRILRRRDGTVVTADCWARLRAARRRGLLPFLGVLVLVGFTELLAIGAGLARLKGTFGAPPATVRRVSLHVLNEPAPIPVPPWTPPVTEQDEPGRARTAAAPAPRKHHHLMGKAAISPPTVKPAVMMGALFKGE